MEGMITNEAIEVAKIPKAKIVPKKATHRI